jgi:hypothetical protein
MHGTGSSTLADRSVPIRMERKAADETVQKLRQGENRAILANLACNLAGWAADTGHSLSSEPAIPEAIGDREGDISTPLLAIADHAGAAWAARARRALLDLFGLQAAEDGNAESGTLLLADIRSLFVEKGSDRMPSKGPGRRAGGHGHPPVARMEGRQADLRIKSHVR